MITNFSTKPAPTTKNSLTPETLPNSKLKTQNLSKAFANSVIRRWLSVWERTATRK